MALPPGFVGALTSALGEAYVITDPDRLTTYNYDGLTG